MGVIIKELYIEMQDAIKELMAALSDTTEEFRKLLESETVTKDHLLRCQNKLLNALTCRLECVASTQALADHLEILKRNPVFMQEPENVEAIQRSIDKGLAFNAGAADTINLLKSNLVKIQFETGIKLQPLLNPTVPMMVVEEELDVFEKSTKIADEKLETFDKPKSKCCVIF